MDESLLEQQVYSSMWTTFVMRKAMSIILYSINESLCRQTVSQKILKEWIIAFCNKSIVLCYSYITSMSRISLLLHKTKGEAQG